MTRVGLVHDCSPNGPAQSQKGLFFLYTLAVSLSRRVSGHVWDVPAASQLSLRNLHKHPLGKAKAIRGKPEGPLLLR